MITTHKKVDIHSIITTKHALHIRSKLSSLWIIVVFNMAFTDIISLHIPKNVEALNVLAENTPTSQLMLFSVITLEIPILMTYLSKELDYRVNRWANIIIAMIMVVFIVGPEIGKSAINSYSIFITMIEVNCLLYIIWTAYRWKNTLL